jgi:hypothetical protein
MDTWGLGGLAGDVGLIVAEFSSNAWTHGSPPVEVTLLPLPAGYVSKWSQFKPS